MRILCSAKDSHIFSTKNNSVFVALANICLTNLCLNDIVKLTMLCTTGSRPSCATQYDIEIVVIKLFYNFPVVVNQDFLLS